MNRRRNPLLSRRTLIKGGALAAAGLSVAPRFLLRAAHAQNRSKRVLVAIFQRGAVDGLNMIVPYKEARYYDLRGSIAVPPPGQPEGGLAIDGDFALHPALVPIEKYLTAGELAVVHACGSPSASRSHFQAQDYMELGTPDDKTTRDGWLNRHLITAPEPGGSLFRACAIEGTLPLILVGDADALATESLAGMTFGDRRRREITVAAATTMYGARTDLLGTSVQDAISAIDLAQSLANLPPSNGANYPTGPLGAKLQDVARLIKGDVGLEIAFVDAGGWDTHAGEGSTNGYLAALLYDTAQCLEAFRTDLGERFEDVCVVTMSEFGRTVAENGSGGTDHGHGTAMLVFGGTVNGGRIYGDWPGLEPADLFEERDLAVTTDFRTLFGELIERHLGNPDVAAVFPGFDYDPASSLGIVHGVRS